MKSLFCLLTALLACTLASCSQKPAPPPPEPEPLPTTFGFTATNAVIEAKDLATDENDKRSLEADFNVDGLNDIAIIKTEGDTQNAVDIFIRQKPEPIEPGEAPGGVRYFKGGTIERPKDGKIIGIASAVDGRMVNIILLITYSNRPNEMVQYVNSGESFTETKL